MALCSLLLEIFRELEAGKRRFGQHNYDELVATPRWLIRAIDPKTICKLSRPNRPRGFSLNG